MHDEVDFEQLLAGARAGEEWAWSELYRRLAPGVLGYLRARGAADPEDLLGECFLQVVRDLERFSGSESDLRAWIFTIAHHRAVDDLRHRARRPVSPASGERLAELGPVGNAEDEALRALGDASVREALRALTEDQRTVLFLRLLAGLSIEEVATVMGKRTGAVKALQHRAVGAVRRVLDAGDGRGGNPAGS
ncbi:MAG TPA: sigma-70 family RNA polymerase sigma factor [Actinomycetota bacterium]|nr:sigma-70 family RNA polymerase sigma factor [Actinomycetota bacterium]